MTKKVNFTVDHYIALILAMYNAGLENALETYITIYRKDESHPSSDDFIADCARNDFKSDDPIKVYQDLIDQAQTNEWGAGVVITKQQAIQVLQLGMEGRLPAGYDVMCKEYGDDDDWVGMTGEDDLELLKDDPNNDYRTFVLTTNDTESFWDTEVMAVSITMNLAGKTEEDVYMALDEAVRLIKEGNVCGFNHNDNGSFSFNASMQSI
jgi:hypothetical protein